ncbi:MAG: hypothetical protein LBH50_03080 [Spirochaetaceae bacterium]|jgi:hypothetical protein|nr:hypothetical protein [Spirochaetaceae bacterium]
MPKQAGRKKIGTNSPGFICVTYPLAALVAILVFRLFFPNAFLRAGEPASGTESQILGIFRIGNSLTRGILDFISLFPAILMSAQFIPFRKIPAGKSARYRRFSPEFFKLLLPQLVTALVTTAVYSLLFLLARPVCADYQVDIRTLSTLFEEAKEKAILFSNNEDWTEASRFLSVCERIWPSSDGLASLREIVGRGLTRVKYNRGDESKAPAENVYGQTELVDAPGAIRLAEAAMTEESYYNAHRLAIIAERLAVPGSVEETRAARIAGAAWNAIESLEPTVAEQEQRSIYRRKREGYEAMTSGDWTRAYYIFRSMTEEIENDPDLQNFFQMCVEGVGQAAFFVNEMDARLGTEITEPVFSLPLFEAEGRVVMRLASISSAADYSYGKDLEIAAFDSDRNPLYSVKAAYVKFLPIFIDEKPLTIVYMQALSGDYEDMRWEPSWSGVPPADAPPNQIALAISYEDFLLASVAGKDLDGFFISDIWGLSKRLASYGYMPEVYQAEIVRVVMEPLMFLPLMMCAIVVGWRLRGRKRHSLMALPMLFLMPLMLNGFVQILRTMLNACGVFAVMSFGFTAALAGGFAAAFLLFALFAVILAAQRS